LREKVACEAGRMRGRIGLETACGGASAHVESVFDPSSVASGDTFSHKGRRAGPSV
jgi:hypothetical protein